MIKKMLDFGAVIDFTLQDGRTLIDLAIQNNQADLLKILIDHNPNFTNHEFSKINQDNGKSKLN